MKKAILVAIGLCCLCGLQAAAQTPGPPPVLQIVREDIKPGMMEPHSREANGTVRIWAKAKSPHHRLALVPVAGNENEVTYLWPFESMAAFGKAQQDLDRIGETYKADFDRTRHSGEDYHSAQRDMLARLRPDLSYNGPVDIARCRFMRVETIRVRPGHVSEFEEGRKIMKAAHEKAKVDENMAVYQVMGGAQSGTYIVLIPWKSLADADGGQPPPHGKEYQDALGDSGTKKIASLASDSIAFNDVNIYAFSPQLSYVVKEWVSADPGFWTLKAITTSSSAPAKKKAAAKAEEKKQ
ncbi:MAG TPA: hypothetical protein VLM38_16660 [Blastocatellia bacterium]|nr:hypothetical protein [Blastocatellia bacterium]